MLRAAPATTALLLLTGGCLWEPIQETPAPGNADVAPVIEAANPSNHEIAVTNIVGAPCVLNPGLPEVYSPRAVGLTARFLLNYGDTTATDPLLAFGGNGQTDFQLQVSSGDPHIYVLPTQEIALKDFLGQLSNSNSTKVLWVFVSDDFALCPDPSRVVTTQQSAASSAQTLDCFTTSWSWVIDLSECALLSAP